MTVVTLTLTDFILARLAEDEETARETGGLGNDWEVCRTHQREDGPGYYDDEYLVREVGEPDFTITPAGGEHGDDGMTRGTARHIARHDPARVLAEVAAKRRIVEKCEAAWARDLSEDYDPEGADWLLGNRWAWHAACIDLASVFADHPDFRAEWANA